MYGEDFKGGKGRGGGRGGKKGGRGGGKGQQQPQGYGAGRGHSQGQQQAPAPAVQQSRGGKGKGGNKGAAPAPAQDPRVTFGDVMPQSATAPPRANANSRTTSTTLSAITDQKFADLPICQATKRAMAEVLRYETMTQVQAQTIPVSLTGTDILAKAKTGTGKTLAFCIPALEHIVRMSAAERNGYVSLLIISPTRELAQQIAEEADQLMTFMTGLSMMCVYGGTNISTDVRKFGRRVPDVLVGTPGRLNDLFANHGLKANMAHLRCMVFDEADQLLDMGFRPAITEMLGHLPPKNTRQTLLFSATMPGDVMNIARFALSDSFKHVDCVGEEKDTHTHVDQTVVVHALENQFPEMVKAILSGIEQDPEGYKILVFFTTAKMTQMCSELFNLMGMKVLEMHSRKSQSSRNSTSAQFRDGKKLVMFSSDVSARGMDYPDVSRVIQVGLPADAAQYTHRLGRTARAGKTGDGLLLLADFETSFVKQLQQKASKVITGSAMPANEAAQIQAKVNGALQRMNPTTMSCAYQAWLGFYNSNLKRLGWSKVELVQWANSWITGTCLCAEVPMLQAKTVGKMGLKGVPGLRVEKGPSGNGGGGKGGGKGRW